MASFRDQSILILLQIRTWIKGKNPELHILKITFANLFYTYSTTFTQ